MLFLYESSAGDAVFVCTESVAYAMAVQVHASAHVGMVDGLASLVLVGKCALMPPRPFCTHVCMLAVPALLAYSVCALCAFCVSLHVHVHVQALADAEPSVVADALWAMSSVAGQLRKRSLLGAASKVFATRLHSILMCPFLLGVIAKSHSIADLVSKACLLHR